MCLDISQNPRKSAENTSSAGCWTFYYFAFFNLQHITARPFVHTRPRVNTFSFLRTYVYITLILS